MKPRHKASAAAIELIKHFEGYRASSAQLLDGGWTIGYGHTKTARPGVTISQDDAEALLLYDLREVQSTVNEWTYAPLTQNQFDALVCFAFNIGVDNFRRSSVLRRVNEGNMVQAACAIEMWRKADLNGQRIVVDALVRRRAAEKSLFLTPVGGWTPAPSPIVRPRVDYDVGLSVPRSSAEISVAMTGPRGEAHAASSGAGEAAGTAEARLRSIAADPSQFAESEAGIDLEPPAPAPAEDPEPLPGAMPEPESAAKAGPPADFALTPPDFQQPLLSPLLEPEGGKRPDEAPLDIPSRIANADASRRIVRREVPMEVEEVSAFGDGIKLGGVQLVGLGLMGLAIFAGSVFWGVNAKGQEGPVDPMVVAAVLGLIGIALVASAVYVLLVRLGERANS